jgi:hypothetical protein
MFHELLYPKPGVGDKERYKRYNRFNEQAEYINGVLSGDPKHRLDHGAERDIGKEIDPYGNCSRDCWCGVIESYGYLAIHRTAEYEYPRCGVTGSARFLTKIMDHLEDANTHHCPLRKLRFRCSGRKLMFSELAACAVIKHLYGRRVYRKSKLVCTR